MILSMLTLAVIIVVMVVAWKWGSKESRPCAKCANSTAPLKWYALFNSWLCHPCAEKTVQQSLTVLYTEISKRL